MGIPKHNKLSARSKNSAKYKADGRRAKNKARHIAAQERFAEKQQEKRALRKEASNG